MSDLWTTKEVEDVAKRACEKSEGFLVKHGEVTPVAHIFGNQDPLTKERRKFLTITALVMPEGTKDATARVLQQTCRAVDASAIVTVMESWVRTIDDAALQAMHDKHGSPLDMNGFQKWVNSERRYALLKETVEPKEAIVICAEHGRRRFQWQMFFTRNPDGKPVLGEWEREEGGMKGRFANLLTGARGS